MSLIARTSNYSYDILIGDILMSSDVVDTEIKIPTFLNGVNHLLPYDQAFFPFSLRQKIYVIHDNLAIALAGLEWGMKIFLEDIKTFFKYKDCTIENLTKFLTEYAFTEIEGTVGYSIFAEKRPEGILMHPGSFGQWQVAKSEIFEEISACGSGSDDYINTALNDMHFFPSGNIHPLNRAITMNYILLCRLLGNERLTLDTIKKFWGAGFEMIYYDGEKFTKVDNITYVLWRGNVDLETITYNVTPFLFLNFKYYDDLLLITVSSGEQLERYVIPPIDVKKEDINLSIFPLEASFDADKICCTYVLELSNGKLATPSFFAEDSERPGIISIDFDENNHLRLMVQSQVEQFLISNLQALIAENKVSWEQSLHPRAG